MFVKFSRKQLGSVLLLLFIILSTLFISNYLVVNNLEGFKMNKQLDENTNTKKKQQDKNTNTKKKQQDEKTNTKKKGNNKSGVITNTDETPDNTDENPNNTYKTPNNADGNPVNIDEILNLLDKIGDGTKSNINIKSDIDNLRIIMNNMKIATDDVSDDLLIQGYTQKIKQILNSLDNKINTYQHNYEKTLDQIRENIQKLLSITTITSNSNTNS